MNYSARDATFIHSVSSRVPPFDPGKVLKPRSVLKPFWRDASGVLYSADCMRVLPLIRSATVDTIFADPPFNLGKEYGAKSNDTLADVEYVRWCKIWLRQCIRILKPGGALFLYNLPRWNVLLGAYLTQRGLTFRHWIAIEHKSGLPIPKRLYPAHYSLLYFTKGSASTFRKIRTPIERCRHCGGEIKDYGGHRHAMNPNGVNLMDVWSDIPPVRHWKFKSMDRKCNAISTKILDRVIEMSTSPGDLVLDPFGGSGTTYAVARSKGRQWIGIDIDFAPVIRERLTSGEISNHKNTDFIEG